MAKKLSRLTTALLETADDMHSAGLMGDKTYRKITVRHLGPDAPPTAAPITPEEIRGVREGAHLSQAALAKYLNLTTGYVSQLERGTSAHLNHDPGDNRPRLSNASDRRSV